MYENNVITQNLAFLSYYAHKMTLFILHKWLKCHNYALENIHQWGPTTMNLYIKYFNVVNMPVWVRIPLERRCLFKYLTHKIMYIENFFCLSWKVSFFSHDPLANVRYVLYFQSNMFRYWCGLYMHAHLCTCKNYFLCLVFQAIKILSLFRWTLILYLVYI